MSPVVGRKMQRVSLACLTLATAMPALSQPALVQPDRAPPSTETGGESDRAGSLYLRGHDAQVRGDLPAALRILDQVITISPHYWPAYVDRGISHFKSGQFELAASDLSKAIELGKPSSALRYPYKLLGICYRKLNRPLDAIRVYSEYIDGTGSADWDGIAQRGEAYAQANEAGKARHDYERALQLAPDNARVIEMMTILDLQTADWAGSAIAS